MNIPRKRFGQHFLHDQSVIQHIIAALAPRPEDHLVEIGPGQGALTVPILKLVKQLEAVELDRDLIPALLAYGNQLTVHSADALSFDFASLKNDERLLRIFGNLPYNISTPLIFHLLTFLPCLSDMLFMLQKEVADRLAAVPNTSDYGRLSVMVQYHCRVNVLFDVPPGAFHPPPKVESSIVQLLPERHSLYPVNNYELFSEIVKQAFGQRRKTLRNSLKHLVSDTIWEQTGISSQLRAEDLQVKDFVAISNAV